MPFVSVPSGSGPGYFSDPSQELDIIHGFRIQVNNHDSIYAEKVKWLIGGTNVDGIPTGEAQQTRAIPYDYQVRVGEFGADTSSSNSARKRFPVNFSIFDITDSLNWHEQNSEADKNDWESAVAADPSLLPNRVVFTLAEYSRLDSINLGLEPDSSSKGYLSVGDEIVLKAVPFMLPNTDIQLYLENSWRIVFSLPTGLPDSLANNPTSGSLFQFTTRKPFDRFDVFEFSMQSTGYTEEKAKHDLNNIFVVPDPYIAASTLEPNIITTSGRGERKIEFVNVPFNCTIKIFTISGHLVQTLVHESDVESGRARWDLRTKDGLEASFGMYIYHVEAPGIGEKIGKFAIIK